MMLRRAFLAGCGWAPLAAAVGTTPAAPQSRAYALDVSPEGDAYLVWIETKNDRHALKLSRLAGDAWTPARTVAEGGDDWFVNWADHPAVSAGPGGRLMVSWPFRPAAARGSKWGLATRMLFSPDRGGAWTKACALGSENTADYTGFIGFWSGEQGFRAAYLSPLAKGAAQHDAAHIKTLRFADFSLDGRLLRDELVDADVCTCCPLATADTAAGPVVVYRDREAGEIRDISVVRRMDGQWTEPRPVHRDGWQINGCPAYGAAIDADGERVATAWFTAAQDRPRVRLALSDDAAASFGPPVEIDAGRPAGWAAVALLDRGRTAVSWLEKRPAEPGAGDVMLRIVDRDGKPGDARSVATAAAGRATGIPQMARRGDSRLVIAWRAAGRVRTTLVDAG